jgi:hypothetical protein
MDAQHPQYSTQARPQITGVQATVLAQVLDTEHRGDEPDWILVVSDADTHLVLDAVRRHRAVAAHLDQWVLPDAGTQRVASVEDVAEHAEATVRGVSQALHVDQPAKPDKDRSLPGDEHLKPARGGIAGDDRGLAALSGVKRQPFREIGNNLDVIALLPVAVGDRERDSHRRDGARKLHLLILSHHPEPSKDGGTGAVPGTSDFSFVVARIQCRNISLVWPCSAFCSSAAPSCVIDLRAVYIGLRTAVPTTYFRIRMSSGADIMSYFA